MTTSLVKWRTYCNTENAWSYKWVEEGITPQVVCFNDPNHVVNANSLSQLNEKVANNQTLLVDERIKTQGNFRCKGYKMSTPGNSTSQVVVQFPYYDINIASGSIIISPECIGDEFSAWVEPYYQGSITQAINAPTTVLTVDPTTVAIACLGYGLQIKRQSDNHIDYLGEIIGINSGASQLTVETPTSGNFIVGDKLIFKIYCFEKLPLQISSRYIIGNNKHKPIFLSKYNKIIGEYKNNNSVTANFGFELEYFY